MLFFRFILAVIHLIYQGFLCWRCMKLPTVVPTLKSYASAELERLLWMSFPTKNDYSRLREIPFGTCLLNDLIDFDIIIFLFHFAIFSWFRNTRGVYLMFQWSNYIIISCFPFTCTCNSELGPLTTLCLDDSFCWSEWWRKKRLWTWIFLTDAFSNSVCWILEYYPRN